MPLQTTTLEHSSRSDATGSKYVLERVNQTLLQCIRAIYNGEQADQVAESLAQVANGEPGSSALAMLRQAGLLSEKRGHWSLSETARHSIQQLAQADPNIAAFLSGAEPFRANEILLSLMRAHFERSVG